MKLLKKAVVDIAIENPALGQLRVRSNELKKERFHCITRGESEVFG